MQSHYLSQTILPLGYVSNNNNNFSIFPANFEQYNICRKFISFSVKTRNCLYKVWEYVLFCSEQKLAKCLHDLLKEWNWVANLYIWDPELSQWTMYQRVPPLVLLKDGRTIREGLAKERPLRSCPQRGYFGSQPLLLSGSRTNSVNSFLCLLLPAWCVALPSIGPYSEWTMDWNLPGYFIIESDEHTLQGPSQTPNVLQLGFYTSET